METQAPFWKRLLWMFGIWAASVISLGVVASIIRLALHARP